MWPWTVVCDTDDLALFRPVGTAGKQRSGEFGGPRGRMLVRWDGGYRDLVCQSVNVTALYRPGDMHSVWRAWDAATWTMRWRYINLEEAWRRTPIGFDSKDLYLDLWAKPERHEWHWKDDDEAAWVIENGRMSEAQLEAVREEGDRAVARIQRRDPPHDRVWDVWRPDPAWPVPTLPAEWKEYEPRDATPR